MKINCHIKNVLSLLLFKLKIIRENLESSFFSEFLIVKLDRFKVIFINLKFLYNMEQYDDDFNKINNTLMTNFCYQYNQILSSFQSSKQSLSDPHTYFSFLQKAYCSTTSPEIQTEIKAFIDKYQNLVFQNYQAQNINNSSHSFSLNSVPSISSLCLIDSNDITLPPSQRIENLRSKIDAVNEEMKQYRNEAQENIQQACAQEQLSNIILVLSSFFEVCTTHYPRCKKEISRQDFVEFFIKKFQEGKDNQTILDEFKEEFHFIDEDV